MKKRITLLCAFLLLFTSSAIFAQQKSANFLGTWKLVESSDKWEEKSGVKWMTMTVTEAAGELFIERSHQKADNAETYSHKTSYKTTGATITRLIAGQYGGVEIRSLRFLKDNKMQLVTTVRRDPDLETILTSTAQRETWKVSEDGKTLTVKSVNRYYSSKMIFTKQ